jgi:hypothetical protein
MKNGLYMFNMDIIFISKNFQSWGVDQMVEHLTSKCEALGTTKKK